MELHQKKQTNLNLTWSLKRRINPENYHWGLKDQQKRPHVWKLAFNME